MAIAMNRFSRLKQNMIQSTKNFFVGIKNSFVQLVTGRKTRFEQVRSEDDEKGLQGENGNVKIRAVDVNINHIAMADLDKMETNFPDSSIGDGMDISIEGVNGDLKHQEKDDISHDSYIDMNIAKGMETMEEKTRISKIQAGIIREKMDGIGEMSMVEAVTHDPVEEDDVVVMDCCPPGFYKTFPLCIGDSDSTFWQLWYKHRLQVSRMIETSILKLLSLL